MPADFIYMDQIGRGLKKSYNHKMAFLSRLMFSNVVRSKENIVLYTQIQQQNSMMSSFL
jgi:hypothetical protein